MNKDITNKESLTSENLESVTGGSNINEDRNFKVGDKVTYLGKEGIIESISPGGGNGDIIIIRVTKNNVNPDYTGFEQTVMSTSKELHKLI